MAICTVPEALEQVLSAVHSLPARKESLPNAFGCVLARDLVASNNLLWVANAGAGTVVRVDGNKHTVVGSTHVGGRPVALATTPGTRTWIHQVRFEREGRP